MRKETANESKPPQAIAFHLGAHKTASSHLQKSILKNQELFEQAGVKFIGPKGLRSDEKAIRSRFNMPNPPNDRLRYHLARIFESNDVVNSQGRTPSEELAFMADGASRLVLSDENYLGLHLKYSFQSGGVFYPLADLRLRHFAKRVAPVPVSIFLGIRNPADHLASNFVQRLKIGKRAEFSTYTKRVDLRALIWSDVIARMSKVSGVDQIIVWRYEDYSKVMTTIIDHMAADNLGDKIEPIAGRVNIGRSAKAVEETQRVVARDDLERQQRRDLMAQMQDTYPISPEYPKFDPWSAEQHRVSAEAYKRDVDRIAKMPKVTLITP